MAPPIPGLRRPAGQQRRTAGDIAAGVLAVLALTVLTVGVPLALITVLGLPFPHSRPTLSLLTHQLNILNIVQVLSIVVWLAWLQLVLCVFAEVRAAIRNVGVPARIPLSGGTQALAHRLVTAALLLVSATAALSPALTHTGPPPRPAHTVSATATPGPSSAPVRTVLTSHETASGSAASYSAAPYSPAETASTTATTTEKIYVVQPPVGRFHESLWEIAENHLGNGLRYREIFELNKDHPQPDGTRLTMASLIRPGWVLRMPRDAYGPGIRVVTHDQPGGGGQPSGGGGTNGPANSAEQASAGQATRITNAETGPPGAPAGSVQGSGTHASGPAAAERTGATQAGQVGEAAGSPGTPASSPQESAAGQAAAEQAGAGSAGAVTRYGTPPAQESPPPSRTPSSAPSTHNSPSTSPSLPGQPGPRSPAPHASPSSGAASVPGAPGGSTGTGSGSRHVPLVAPAQPGRLQLDFPHELSAATLLSAGVLAAVGRRRREQLWQRAFGRRVVMPEGPAARAEEALRLGADEPSVRLLDTGLRSLSQELAAHGRTPPMVFAAHLGEVNLDLWIAPADPHPPLPWLAVDDGQVWRLPLSAVAGLDPDEAGAALAPYPGLVSIGTNDNGRMLVDLEVAHGLIAVRGSRHMVQSVLAGMAVELATNRWSDRMRITLVGFGPELEMLAPERVSVAQTVEEALPVLEASAVEITQALDGPGADSVLAGRSRGLYPDSWAPHYLIMAIPPTPQQRDRLLALATTQHRTAMGFVVAGDVPGAAWTWDISEQGRLHAGVLGFDLRAQLLPPDQYRAVVELFRSADRTEGVPLGAPAAIAVPRIQLTPGTRMPVEVTMLGPVMVEAPGSIEPDRVSVATEIVAYLAAHPEGTGPYELTDAIWPRGVAPEVASVALARVRDWLGADDTGQPNLVTDASGLMRLGAQVRVDWQVFRSLVGWAEKARQAAIGDRTYRDPSSGEPDDQAIAAEEEEIAYLSRALDLVGGQLLDGRDPGRYAWLATDPLEYEATAWIADTAHRLADLRLASSDADGAMEAVRAGLRLAFNDEMLWRDLLIAAHATGYDHVLRAVVGEVSARVSLDDVLPRMAPETEALIDELLPSWRSSVA